VNAKYGSIDQILYPIQTGTLEFVGFSILPSEIHFSIERITDEERQEILEIWSNRLKNIFPNLRYSQKTLKIQLRIWDEFFTDHN